MYFNCQELKNEIREVSIVSLDESVSSNNLIFGSETKYYNRACLEALLGNPDLALDLLEKSLGEDPSRREWAQKDPDLRSLRSHPRYRALVGLPPLE